MSRIIPRFLGPGKDLTRRGPGVVGGRGGGQQADSGLGHAGFEIFISHLSGESQLGVRPADVEWECTNDFQWDWRRHRGHMEIGVLGLSSHLQAQEPGYQTAQRGRPRRSSGGWRGLGSAQWLGC